MPDVDSASQCNTHIRTTCKITIHSNQPFTDIIGTYRYILVNLFLLKKACCCVLFCSSNGLRTMISRSLIPVPTRSYLSATTAKGNRYVLVMVDCFSRWTEACPLPDKMALAVADAFFQHIVCRFGMPSVIHSDQGREFENKVIQELCLLCGAHKTRTTHYHPESDGLVVRFNITLPIMLAMFTGENRDDWDDLLPVVVMAYRSSVHESYK